MDPEECNRKQIGPGFMSFFGRVSMWFSLKYGSFSLPFLKTGKTKRYVACSLLLGLL